MHNDIIYLRIHIFHRESTSKQQRQKIEQCLRNKIDFYTSDKYLLLFVMIDSVYFLAKFFIVIIKRNNTQTKVRCQSANFNMLGRLLLFCTCINWKLRSILKYENEATRNVINAIRTFLVLFLFLFLFTEKKITRFISEILLQIPII